jgi:hypothetical protein
MVTFNDTVVIPEGYCTFVVSLENAGNPMNLLAFQVSTGAVVKLWHAIDGLYMCVCITVSSSSL